MLSIIISFSLLSAAPAGSEANSGILKDWAARPAVREALGVDLKVTESHIRRSVIRTRTPYGFLIRGVDEGSIAALAGLKVGDVLLEWSGKPVRSIAELLEWVKAAKPDESIQVRVSRKKARVRLHDRHPWQEIDLTVRPR